MLANYEFYDEDVFFACILHAVVDGSLSTTIRLQPPHLWTTTTTTASITEKPHNNNKEGE
jgi:hypothetical protein